MKKIGFIFSVFFLIFVLVVCGGGKSIENMDSCFSVVESIIFESIKVFVIKELSSKVVIKFSDVKLLGIIIVDLKVIVFFMKEVVNNGLVEK